VTLPILITAAVVLGGCSQGADPQPTAQVGPTTPVGGVTSPAASATAQGGAAGATTGKNGSSGSTKGSGNQGGDGKPSGEGAPPDLAQGGPKTVVITVAGKNVTPRPGKVAVKKGEQVLLVVITDADNEVHVHGVDIEKATKRATPTQIPLTFKDKGSYEVELHDPELLLTKFVVS
jgi:hypothetical protein